MSVARALNTESCMLVLRKTLKSPSLFQQINRFLTTQNARPCTIPKEPTSDQYDELINAAGGEKDFTTVHHLLNRRIKDGFFNTNNTFKFIATDLSVLDDLLRTLPRLDEGFSRKSAYDSLIARLCKLSRTDLALRVVDETICSGYGANAVTFHPILLALTRKKKMKEALRVIDLMRENDIAPDLFAYNSILTAYCFTGDLASAAGVLTRIGEEGMEANSWTYDALVLGACRAGKVEGALALLRRMVDSGLRTMYATHGHVIGALLELGYFAQAVEFVKAYGGRDMGLDSENFRILASRLINLNRFDEATFVLREMKERGLPMKSGIEGFL